MIQILSVKGRGKVAEIFDIRNLFAAIARDSQLQVIEKGNPTEYLKNEYQALLMPTRSTSPSLKFRKNLKVRLKILFRL